MTDAADASSVEAATCVPGSLVFALYPASGDLTAYCLGGPGSCSSEWLSIRAKVGGASFPINRPCEAQCSVCQPVGCPALCAAPTSLGSGGAMRTWDGTYYAPGTCGAAVSCYEPACVPAGTYVVTMCGYAEQSGGNAPPICNPVLTSTCADVEFSWPPPAGTIVQGTLPAAGSPDAGACCPTAWNLYSCTYQDGGEGFACHNPALGCASSTTCGQGCDSIVTGRCDGG